ncbi:hypothetical protein IAT40_004764 [Kwoniella sp. CBS 6097]
MWDLLKGSTLLYENTTGKVAVGRRRYKDRLLRHTTEVTLFSHGDEDDDEQETEKEEEENELDYFNFKRFSILSLSSSSTKDHPRGTPRYSPSPSLASAAPSHRLTPPINVMRGDCPPIPLSGVMPRLDRLRIVLQDAYDYHLLFCPRLSKCPLLEGLEVDKLVILGARSPLVVLPICFPATHRSTPVTPSLLVNSSPLLRFSAELLDEDETLYLPGQRPGSAAPSIMTGKSSNTAKAGYTGYNKSTSSSGGLPFGLSELTIVMPSGRSYDAKDYEDYHHIFHHRHSVNSLTKFTVVFLSHPKPSTTISKPKSAITSQSNTSTKSKLKSKFSFGRSHNDTYNAAVDCGRNDQNHADNDDAPWQIAFYDSRPGNPNWTSYLNLAEDLTKSIISVPLETSIEIVGLENLDGELLNMGVGVMRAHRSGVIMQERIKRRIEVRLKAEGRDRDVGQKIGNTRFRDLNDWLIDGGRTELGKEGMKEYHDDADE